MRMIAASGSIPKNVGAQISLLDLAVCEFVDPHSDFGGNRFGVVDDVTDALLRNPKNISQLRLTSGFFDSGDEETFGAFHAPWITSFLVFRQLGNLFCKTQRLQLG